jgi:hypothetical protein
MFNAGVRAASHRRGSLDRAKPVSTLLVIAVGPERGSIKKPPHLVEGINTVHSSCGHHSAGIGTWCVRTGCRVS